MLPPGSFFVVIIHLLPVLTLAETRNHEQAICQPLCTRAVRLLAWAKVYQIVSVISYEYLAFSAIVFIYYFTYDIF